MTWYATHFKLNQLKTWTWMENSYKSAHLWNLYTTVGAFLLVFLLFLLLISCTSFEQEICYNVLHLNMFFEHLQPSLQQRYRSYGGFKHN